MLVEFIIDKEDYKQVIKKISFTASNGLEVAKRSLKANGKENYYLKINCPNNTLESAKALSEIRDLIEQEFKSNDINNYRILIDEASQYFTTALYPLIMEFETKLRKFIHNTLFDVSEVSTQRVVSQLITSLKIDKGYKEIPKFDFLELTTLEKIYLFLFQNNELYGDLNKYTSDEKKRCATKKELIEYLTNNGIDTIWNVFFANDFDDSSLPKTFEDIIGIRNDVMHFHYMSFNRYDESVKLIKSAIQDLDKQIKKGIVIENTSQNVEKLSRNIDYQQSIYIGLRGLDELRDVVHWSAGITTFDSLSSVSSMITDLSRNLFTPAYNASLSNIISQLSPTITGIPQLDGINDVTTKLCGVLPITPSLMSEPTKIISLPNNDKKGK